MLNYVTTKIAGCRGWILPQYDAAPWRECLTELLGANTVAQKALLGNSLTTASDREVYRIAFQGKVVYLKRYLLTTWKQALQTLFYLHKAQKSWRIGRKLCQRGISTPLPIAYLPRCTSRIPFFSLFGECWLMTQGVTPGLSIAAYAQQGLNWRGKRVLLRRVAEFLAQLHVAGVYHGDLTAQNILVAEPDEAEQAQTENLAERFQVYLIDLDAVRLKYWMPEECRIKNIDELGRNFLDLRVLSTADRGRFLKYYLQANPRETRTFRQLFQRVWERTQEQLQKNQKQFFRTQIS
jgi:tRNA A-37 threonylcarbamoyl transferase component Bud32